MRKRIARSIALGLVGLLIQQGSGAAFGPPPYEPPTATPIKHLVVIFPENISFDHYFGTYPNATNPPGEPPFHAQPGTPSVNGLSGGLLTSNPNFLNVPTTALPSAAVARARRSIRFALIGAKPRPPTRTTTTRPSSKRMTQACWTCSRSGSATNFRRRPFRLSRPASPMALRWATTTATP